MQSQLALRALAAVAAAVATTVSPAAQAAPSAVELAGRIQAHYATVKDFTADFTITATSSLVRAATPERGEVKIKKPARMRWAYSTTDKKLFVADGVKLYSYFPKDKYVDVTQIPQGEQASTALLFLAGRGDLTRDFLPSLPAQHPEGEWELILKPKGPQTDFTTLTLQVDRTSYQFRGFIVVDDQGSTSKFRFANLRENVGVADRDFEFTIPNGVEVR